MTNLLPSTSGPGFAVEDFFIMAAAILLSAAVVFIWAIFFRKKRKRKHRRRPGEERAMNPTLARTGGLPPVRKQEDLQDQV
jgi:hypothetical protein